MWLKLDMFPKFANICCKNLNIYIYELFIYVSKYLKNNLTAFGAILGSYFWTKYNNFPRL